MLRRTCFSFDQLFWNLHRQEMCTLHSLFNHLIIQEHQHKARVWNIWESQSQIQKRSVSYHLRECGKQYVGDTMDNLNMRANKHNFSITNKNIVFYGW